MSIGRLRSALLSLSLLAGLAAGCTNHSAPKASSTTKVSLQVLSGQGQLLSDPAINLRALACPSEDGCMAVGSGASESPAWFQSSQDSPWLPSKVPNNSADLYALACSAADFCMAGGSDRNVFSPTPQLWRSVDGGQAWIKTRSPRSLGTVQRIACSSLACVLIGLNAQGNWSASTKDGGRSWSAPKLLPEALVAAGGISCEFQRCIVVGFGPDSTGNNVAVIASSTDLGAHWKLRDASGISPLYGLSCRDAQHCEAVGISSEVSTDGSTQRRAILASGSFAAAWHQKNSRLLDPLVAGYALSCEHLSNCVIGGSTSSGSPAISQAALGTLLQGKLELIPLTYAPAAIAAIACPGSLNCRALGARSVITFKP
ncbi:MAG: hypothetical protein WCO31_05255 [Actinomycetes bacterium]